MQYLVPMHCIFLRRLLFLRRGLSSHLLEEGAGFDGTHRECCGVRSRQLLLRCSTSCILAVVEIEERIGWAHAQYRAAHGKRWSCKGYSSTPVSPNPRYFLRNLTQGVRDRPLRRQCVYIDRLESRG